MGKIDEPGKCLAGWDLKECGISRQTLQIFVDVFVEKLSAAIVRAIAQC